jgi:hypothetical protein
MNRSWRDSCSLLFIAASLPVAKRKKHSELLWTGELDKGKGKKKTCCLQNHEWDTERAILHDLTPVSNLDGLNS